MRQAVGGSFILNLVITFITLLMLIFAGSISYSKAFKVKNRITNIIEENGGYNYSATSDVQEQINSTLSEIGYQIGTMSKKSKCEEYIGNNRKSDVEVVYPLSEFSSGYRYCIIRYNTTKGYYYGVVTFMKFDFPIIGDYLEFPIYGETKVFNTNWN